MSRASAGVLHYCDTPACTAVSFTADGSVPPDWTRLTAAGEHREDLTEGPRIGVDLCPAHGNVPAGHEPSMPGILRFPIVGNVLYLVHAVACSCGFEVDQVLPTANAAARNALVTAVWLAHIPGFPAASEHDLEHART